MHIVFVSPEMDPLIKVGGLADVVFALSQELRRRQEQVSVILPYYRAVDRRKFPAEASGVHVKVDLDGSERRGQVWRHRHQGVDVFLLDSPEYYDREEVYGVRGTDYRDNAYRFAFLARGALEAIRALNLQPGVIHIHDWQTGLLPVYKRLFYSDDERIGRAGVVLSIHNLGYQGLFPPEILPALGLPREIFHVEGVEFYGKVSFLKGGLVYSDLLSTVSPTYAREIQTESFGAGLDGLLRKRSADLAGILNGIDPTVWNPETDERLAAPYSVEDLRGKAVNKETLQQALGLTVSRAAPLFGCIARLDPQKGFDLLLEAAPQVFDEGAQLVVLGSGRQEYVDAFRKLEKQYPLQLSVNEGFQADLASRIYAGVDLFLMPSRYEPCGLGQMIALRYGTIPVVRRTGGLADTIVDVDNDPVHGNGFVFEAYESPALVDTIRRALKQFSQPRAWKTLIHRAMTADFSWARSAGAYQDVYRRAAGKAQG